MVEPTDVGFAIGIRVDSQVALELDITSSVSDVQADLRIHTPKLVLIRPLTSEPAPVLLQVTYTNEAHSDGI